MKVAIICDSLTGGGAQRVVLNLAKAFNADVYTGYKSSNSKQLEEVNIKRILLKKRFRPNTIFSFYLLNLFKHNFIKKDYDIYIFSGNFCISAVDKYKPNIWYCHTPSRGLYVERKRILREGSLKAKISIELFRYLLYRQDQYYAKKFNIIVANSGTTKERIYKAYGYDLENKVVLVYPPIDVKGFKWKGQEDFYLSTARLVPMKRVSLIVRAFRKMPNKKLIVVSTGSEMKVIKKLAEGYLNIDIRGALTDKELQDLVGNCIATIYIPFKEDFGISPVEGMAAGKPCIGVAEGGLKETVINGKTGYLCPANPNINDLIKAVNFMNTSRALDMKKTCEERSRLFSKEIFLSKMGKIINSFSLNLLQ